MMLTMNRLEAIKRKLTYLFPGASEVWVQVVGETLHQLEVSLNEKLVQCDEDKDRDEQKG